MSSIENVVTPVPAESLIGRVKWFNNKAGYGFITVTDGSRSGTDVFVHHSITGDNGAQEGIPNAVAEAMAMELPVISTFHAGIPELVENNVNGFLIKEKDIENYVHCMQEIIKWDYLPTNRTLIESRFSIQSHIKNLLNIYENISTKV